MAIDIIKQTSAYPKSSRIEVIKEKVVRSADNYKEALEIVQSLNDSNRNQNVMYTIGKTISK